MSQKPKGIGLDYFNPNDPVQISNLVSVMNHIKGLIPFDGEDAGVTLPKEINKKRMTLLLMTFVTAVKWQEQPLDIVLLNIENIYNNLEATDDGIRFLGEEETHFKNPKHNN